MSRQIDVIDVIDERERVRTVGLATDAIVSRGQVSHPDLTCEAIASGRLDLTRSKNDTPAAFDVTAYPLFQTALSAIPATARNGPLVTNEASLRMRRRY
jgi:hypothetical protein